MDSESDSNDSKAKVEDFYNGDRHSLISATKKLNRQIQILNSKEGLQMGREFLSPTNLYIS